MKKRKKKESNDNDFLGVIKADSDAHHYIAKSLINELSPEEAIKKLKNLFLTAVSTGPEEQYFGRERRYTDKMLEELLSILQECYREVEFVKLEKQVSDWHMKCAQANSNAEERTFEFLESIFWQFKIGEPIRRKIIDRIGQRFSPWQIDKKDCQDAFALLLTLLMTKEKGKESYGRHWDSVWLWASQTLYPNLKQKTAQYEVFESETEKVRAVIREQSKTGRVEEIEKCIAFVLDFIKPYTYADCKYRERSGKEKGNNRCEGNIRYVLDILGSARVRDNGEQALADIKRAHFLKDLDIECLNSEDIEAVRLHIQSHIDKPKKD